jgi:radical SAM protein with 4Fe4S-binding SPASM domain
MEYKALIRLANNKTVLETIVDSLRQIKMIDRIVLATSDSMEDRLIIAEAERLQISSYAGERINVLDRLRNACQPHKGLILKVDGNKPLFDPIEAEKLIRDHAGNGCEYSYNGHYYGVIYGTDCEVFHSDIFDKLNIGALTTDQQETGTVHIRANPKEFNIYGKKYDNPRPFYRVLLENRKDLDVINNILKHVPTISNDAIIPFFDDNQIIAGHNRKEGTKEIGLNKIILFPHKIEALHKVEACCPDPTYPISVELSLTNRCNFNCVWCSDKQLRLTQEDDMSLSTINNLACDLAAHGARGVTIEGGGEPTIADHFNEAINLFRQKGLALGLITNGSIRLQKDIVDQFDWIRVSLDASCHEEMARLKKSNRFEDVVGNIIYYAKCNPIVGIGYVATKDNLSQIESLIIRIRETGVNYIQFRPVIDHAELKPDYDFSYLVKYQTEGFSIISDGMQENIIKGNDHLSCRCHSLSTVITADGSVFMCGRLNIHQWLKPIGNVNNDSFHSIWHGEERKIQNSQVMDGNFCAANCPECRMTKFNVEFDRLKRIKTINFI